MEELDGVLNFHNKVFSFGERLSARGRLLLDNQGFEIREFFIYLAFCFGHGVVLKDDRKVVFWDHMSSVDFGQVAHGGV